MKKISAFLLSFFIAVNAPSALITANAYTMEDVCTYAQSSTCNDLHQDSGDDIKTLLGTSGIVNWLLIAVGVLAVTMIIISGIQFAMSAGDAEKVKKAKNRLLWSVIGLAVALLATLIINLAVYMSDLVKIIQ